MWKFTRWVLQVSCVAKSAILPRAETDVELLSRILGRTTTLLVNPKLASPRFSIKRWVAVVIVESARIRFITPTSSSSHCTKDARFL